MPVAEDLQAPARERILNPLTDGLGRSAIAHEHRLLSAARPALPFLNWLGMFAKPLMKVPGLGWITADPLTARAVLNDPDHFTLLSEGGVGHLWAQILGDWVYELFDGPGHYDLRTRSRELFTEKTSFDFVERAWGERIQDARVRFDAGEAIDLADLSRMLVGQMVVTLLGMPVVVPPGGTVDDAYRDIFATGEELASTALGTTADTVLPPEKIRRAREIVERLTGHIDDAFATASGDTIIGRCRDLGLSLQETKGLSTLLMVAGTETAASAMSRTAALLYDTGEQHALIANPKLMEGAVREALRVTSPAPVIGRSVLADLDDRRTHPQGGRADHGAHLDGEQPRGRVQGRPAVHPAEPPAVVRRGAAPVPRRSARAGRAHEDRRAARRRRAAVRGGVAALRTQGADPGVRVAGSAKGSTVG